MDFLPLYFPGYRTAQSGHSGGGYAGMAALVTFLSALPVRRSEPHRPPQRPLQNRPFARTIPEPNGKDQYILFCGQTVVNCLGNQSLWPDGDRTDPFVTPICRGRLFGLPLVWIERQNGTVRCPQGESVCPEHFAPLRQAEAPGTLPASGFGLCGVTAPNGNNCTTFPFASR